MAQRLIHSDLGRNLSTTGSLRVAESLSSMWLVWLVSICTGLILWYMRDANPLPKVPLITIKSLWDISGKKARERFALNARGVIEEGFKQVWLDWK